MKVFVGAIIENPEFGFLLQKRDNIPEISFPGLWTLFGGKVEAGESVEQGLFRELEEELCFKKEFVESSRIIWDIIKSDGNRQVIFHILTNVSISDLVLGEGESFGFFKKKDVLSKDFAFNIRDVLESFFS